MSSVKGVTSQRLQQKSISRFRKRRAQKNAKILTVNKKVPNQEKNFPTIFTSFMAS